MLDLRGRRAQPRARIARLGIGPDRAKLGALPGSRAASRPSTPIDTPGLRGLAGMDSEGLSNAYSEHVPAGRVGRPEDIASAVAFLASDESSFVTGTELFVDGGLAQV